jgi:hypothetical protein
MAILCGAAKNSLRGTGTNPQLYPYFAKLQYNKADRNRTK